MQNEKLRMQKKQTLQNILQQQFLQYLVLNKPFINARINDDSIIFQTSCLNIKILVVPGQNKAIGCFIRMGILPVDQKAYAEILTKHKQYVIEPFFIGELFIRDNKLFSLQLQTYRDNNMLNKVIQYFEQVQGTVQKILKHAENNNVEKYSIAISQQPDNNMVNVKILYAHTKIGKKIRKFITPKDLQQDQNIGHLSGFQRHKQGVPYFYSGIQIYTEDIIRILCQDIQNIDFSQLQGTNNKSNMFVTHITDQKILHLNTRDQLILNYKNLKNVALDKNFTLQTCYNIFKYKENLIYVDEDLHIKNIKDLLQESKQKIITSIFNNMHLYIKPMFNAMMMFINRFDKDNILNEYIKIDVDDYSEKILKQMQGQNVTDMIDKFSIVVHDEEPIELSEQKFISIQTDGTQDQCLKFLCQQLIYRQNVNIKKLKNHQLKAYQKYQKTNTENQQMIQINEECKHQQIQLDKIEYINYMKSKIVHEDEQYVVDFTKQQTRGLEVLKFNDYVHFIISNFFETQ